MGIETEAGPVTWHMGLSVRPLRMEVASDEDQLAGLGVAIGLV